MLVIRPWPGMAMRFWAFLMPFLSPTAFLIISSLIIPVSLNSISIPFITPCRAFTLFSERASPWCRIRRVFLSYSFFKHIFPVNIYLLLFRSLFPLSLFLAFSSFFFFFFTLRLLRSLSLSRSSRFFFFLPFFLRFLSLSLSL